MESWPLLDDLFDLMREPSIDKFLSLRKSVVKSKKYSPYSTAIHDMLKSVNAGNASGAVELFERTLPNFIVCPRAHSILHDAFKVLNNDEVAEFEKDATIFILQAIMRTGNGKKNILIW